MRLARFTSTATAVASLVPGPAALADAPAASADAPLEEVVVTGLRASLTESLDAKRNSEFGDFALGDFSVADIYIQRLPEEPPSRWSRAGFQVRDVAIANDKSGERKS
jgi:hypothetical protein